MVMRSYQKQDRSQFDVMVYQIQSSKHQRGYISILIIIILYTRAIIYLLHLRIHYPTTFEQLLAHELVSHCLQGLRASSISQYYSNQIQTENAISIKHDPQLKNKSWKQGPMGEYHWTRSRRLPLLLLLRNIALSVINILYFLCYIFRFLVFHIICSLPDHHI